MERLSFGALGLVKQLPTSEYDASRSVIVEY